VSDPQKLVDPDGGFQVILDVAVIISSLWIAALINGDWAAIIPHLQ
jgi:hypothetical protein